MFVLIVETWVVIRASAGQSRSSKRGR
jgi:hypothetical protein